MYEECIALQVRNIFQLYADIEHTSRNNAFYEKYNLRYSMGDLLRKRHSISSVFSETTKHKKRPRRYC